MTEPTSAPPAAPALPPPLPPVVIPYASPVMYPTEVAWREGDVLIVRHGAMLTDRCIKCAAPADGPPMRRQLYWHHPALFLLILAGVLVYAVVALLTRKGGVVFVNLCPAHRQKRTLMILIAWALGLGGLAVVIAGAVNEMAPLVLAGIAMFIGGIFVGLFSQPLRPKRIDEYFMWIKGVSPELLATLPEVRRP